MYIFRAKEPILIEAELDNIDAGDPSLSGTLNGSLDSERLSDDGVERLLCKITWRVVAVARRIAC